MGEYTFHTGWGYAHLMCGAIFTYLFVALFHRIQFGFKAGSKQYTRQTLKRGLIGACIFHLCYEIKDFLAHYRIEPGLTMQRHVYGFFYNKPPEEISDSTLNNSPLNSVGDIFYFTIGQFLAYLMITHPLTKGQVFIQFVSWVICLGIFIYNDMNPVTSEMRDIQVKRIKKAVMGV